MCPQFENTDPSRNTDVLGLSERNMHGAPTPPPHPKVGKDATGTTSARPHQVQIAPGPTLTDAAAWQNVASATMGRTQSSHPCSRTHKQIHSCAQLLDNNTNCLINVSGDGLLLSQLKTFGSLQAKVGFGLALLALNTQHNLFRGLGFLVKDRLGLPTETHLLAVITAFSLREVRGFTSFVLGDLVFRVLLAFFAERVLLLRCVNHFVLATNINMYGVVDICYDQELLLHLNGVAPSMSWLPMYRAGSVCGGWRQVRPPTTGEGRCHGMNGPDIQNQTTVHYRVYLLPRNIRSLSDTIRTLYTTNVA